MTLTRFWHESGTQFTPSEIEKMVAKHGRNILIGGDPGWSEFNGAMEECDRERCFKHVYLVGPGMMEWSEEERKEIMSNARSVGIDTKQKSWQQKWFKEGGWELKVRQWFKDYDKAGFYSAEIDNLDAIWDQSPTAYVAFLKRFDAFHTTNKLKIKLMVKNLSIEQLNAVIEYKPRTGLLCEWGMFEKGSGNSTKQIELAAKLGIQAVTPKNGLRPTENYGTVRKGIPALGM